MCVCECVFIKRPTNTISLFAIHFTTYILHSLHAMLSVGLGDLVTAVVGRCYSCGLCVVWCDEGEAIATNYSRVALLIMTHILYSI